MTRRGKTQYVRAEDEEKWNAIENKSAWIHEHLNHEPASLQEIVQKVVNVSAEGTLELPTGIYDRSGMTFCPNSHPMALDGRSCLGKGCKYAG